MRRLSEPDAWFLCYLRGKSIPVSPNLGRGERVEGSVSRAQVSRFLCDIPSDVLHCSLRVHVFRLGRQEPFCLRSQTGAAKEQSRKLIRSALACRVGALLARADLP